MIRVMSLRTLLAVSLAARPPERVRLTRPAPFANPPAAPAVRLRAASARNRGAGRRGHAGAPGAARAAAAAVSPGSRLERARVPGPHQAASGDFGQAAATLERALRIEPDNPLLWIELGRIRLAESNPAQADCDGAARPCRLPPGTPPRRPPPGT